MQSLVPSLSLNNLISLTTFYSVVFLSFDKLIPLRIDKNRTPPDWQNWDPSGLTKSDPSGLVKLGPLRIDKNRTPPDWQKQDPIGLAKTGPLRIGKIKPLRIGKNRTPPDGQIMTPPDWRKQDLSGLTKFGLLRIGKNSFSGTFYIFHPIPFRIRSPMLLCCRD